MDRNWLILLVSAGAVFCMIWGLYCLGIYYTNTKKLWKTLKPIMVKRKGERSSLFLWFGNWYDRTESGQRLAALLKNAGIGIKPSEYFALLALLFGLCCYLAHNFLDLFFPLDIFCAYLLVKIGSARFLKMKQQKLVDALNRQLPDICRLLSSSVKAGLNIQQGIELAAREQKPPAQTVFTELAHQLQLGNTLENAFSHIMEGLPSKELRLMGSTIIVQRKAGGNMARVLEEMSQTLENRDRVNQELRGKTAETKFVAMVLPFMPIIAGLVLNISFPGFFLPLFTPLGLILAAVVIGIETVGFILIAKITDIRV
ncbi:MAG: hypothetical protein CVU89_00380 [Firmicutes bacterium HGW-Firmicutes-14]|nr:MAG: hypothetical protein CVU89_00380 [Firmicutes bacterium HGW-Firmicutes-14]